MTGMRISNEKAVGTSVLPDEAKPLLDGEARFLNDISFPGMYHVAFVRSQHAHALLRSVDTSRAKEHPGVIKVLTGQDLFGKVDPFRSMPNRFSGGESVQHWLAVDKVRFCGEAICAVVAPAYPREANNEAAVSRSCSRRCAAGSLLPILTQPPHSHRPRPGRPRRPPAPRPQGSEPDRTRPDSREHNDRSDAPTSKTHAKDPTTGAPRARTPNTSA